MPLSHTFPIRRLGRSRECYCMYWDLLIRGICTAGQYCRQCVEMGPAAAAAASPPHAGRRRAAVCGLMVTVVDVE